MLGFLAGDYYVGLYNASVKINRIILALVTSLGVVLIPRLSYFVKNKKIDEFKKYVGKSFNFVLMLSIPCVVLMIFLSENIILFLSGKQFHEAVLSMQIIAPIILLIGLSNILGIQILIPFNKEKYVLYSVSIGAIVNFSLNLFLIPIYQHIGAAIATIIAEIAVTITQFIFVSHVLKIRIFKLNRLIYLLLAVVLIPLILLIKQIDLSLIIEMFLTGIVFFVVYFLVLYLSKDEFFYKTVYLKLIRRLKNV
jgi:O-antigen/teichoic acid export membrane protein